MYNVLSLIGLPCYFIFFFFSSRRRHTRFDCDWSSDVCSSDLAGEHERPPPVLHQLGGDRVETIGAAGGERDKIGRAACRGRGEISGGAASFKKKNNDNITVHAVAENLTPCLQKVTTGATLVHD